ncbi:MAG: L-histidine N(alpha)-methyltransferase [Planctomycetes bacterium]|nr:L-histidine N(alpha)-methyltransferase [Planctomycetota bacterium]
MTNGYKVLTPADLGNDLTPGQFALDVLNGLGEMPKRLPSRWFYDAEGSRLFQLICDLPEYYLTRAEHEILTRHAPDIIARAAKQSLDIVDLGAGDGRKTNLLLDAALKRVKDPRFVPIDISEAAMRGLVADTGRAFPVLDIQGLVGEYADALHFFSKDKSRPSLVMFLGSNIGNFEYPAARSFLRQVWGALNPGDLVLIGFDRKKDISQLIAAYNDSAGVTARFDLNLLARINRELGGRFDLGKFEFFATWNPIVGAIESYLVSREKQSVPVAGVNQTFHFEAWEPIHMEHSFKYGDHDIAQLAAATGYEIVAEYTDEKGWFKDSLWRVRR